MKLNILLTGNIDRVRSLGIELIARKHRVTAILSDTTDSRALAALKGIRVFCGDATDMALLTEAGASGMDMAVAICDRDEDSLIVCELCKKLFGIAKTACAISRSENADFFHKMGVDAVFCTTSSMLGMIDQVALMDGIAELKPVCESRMSVVEARLNDKSPLAGKRLCDAGLPGEIIVGCIIRGDDMLIPRGDTRLRIGDSLVLLCRYDRQRDFVMKLAGR